MLHVNYVLKMFTEIFLVFLKQFNWRQQKIRFLTSANLNFKKESDAYETPGKNLT